MWIGQEVQAVLRQAVSRMRLDRYTFALPALLAQLVEQLTLNQRVKGSSPLGGIMRFGASVGRPCAKPRVTA